MQLNTFQRFKAILREPRFANDLERIFALKYVRICEHYNAAIWHVCHATYWPLGLLLGFIFGFDRAVLIAMAAIGLPTSIVSLIIYTKVRSTKVTRLTQLVFYIACSLTSFICCRIDMLDGVGHRGVAAYWIFGAFIGIGLLAYRNYVHLACISIVLTLAGIGFWPYPEPLVGFSVLFVLLLITSNAQIVSHRAFKLHAIETFRLQSQFTPKHMIIASLDQHKPIEQIFAPKAREGVYLCADWRGFQDWCKKVDPETISNALRDYFDSLIGELNTLMPDGNFFADWIADELFVAMFTTETCDAKMVGERAVMFAEKILTCAELSRAQYGAPRGIDVGISYGTTIMGILGPSASMKATALGEVAGEARRLQTVGKELRTTGSNTDSIILSAALAQKFDAKNAGFTCRNLSADIAVKDLDALHIWVRQKTTKPSKVQEAA